MKRHIASYYLISRWFEYEPVSFEYCIPRTVPDSVKLSNKIVYFVQDIDINLKTIRDSWFYPIYPKYEK